MKSFLRLIRFPNLLIIILTMFLIRYCIIQPILNSYGIDLKYSFSGFSILVAAIVIIGAGGYLINDYFDVNIDLVNRPQKVTVGKIYSERSVYYAYFILNAIALILAGFACVMAGKFSLFILFPVAIGGLWFYSTTYKSQLFVGTLLVSLFTAMVPMLVLIFEIPSLYKNYHTFTEAYRILVKILTGWCGFYALFAFVTNFIREIIKDAEDFEGDVLSDRRTFPIVYGVNATKAIIAGLILLVILVLEYLFFIYLQTSCKSSFDTLSFFYIHLLIVIPLLASLFLVLVAKNKKDFSIASALVKLVIVSGVLYSVLVRYNFTKCV